ncbi:LCP family protein [Calderihabitans maritimus]|uniref:Transcriptional regulator n=1 Tax=Calderihabitans maritimus TaxID=1246530 RepID=A0A1Z5HWD5_9FIRM|nr:LCP family protein [Calderihabitans maritimus]GAW93853.1 transcriptional regulator [Calderihabitans maritimus]
MKENHRNNLSFDEEFWGTRGTTGLKRRRKKRRRVISGTLTWLLLIIVFFGAFTYIGFRITDSWLSPGVDSGERDGQALADTGSRNLKRFNILLLGVDQREDETSRADTIMVAFLDPGEKTVRLLSIPRDTYAEIPGRGREKINHAHAYGGPELMVKTVENFLGISLDGYVEVNFEGFIKVIDLLGGVKINVEKRMHYPPEGINLYPGLQTLDGQKALQYVRFRSDGRGDIGRIERQQKFLQLLADQALRLKNLPKLPGIIQEIWANTRTDLSLTEIISLTAAFKEVEEISIEAKTVPGEPTYINGLSYWKPDHEQLQKIIDAFTRH